MQRLEMAQSLNLWGFDLRAAGKMPGNPPSTPVPSCVILPLTALFSFPIRTLNHYVRVVIIYSSQWSFYSTH
jgi:hypothetical protein